MIYGRSLRQLLIVWGVSLLLLIGVYRIELNIPALHDILLPIYWLIFGAAAFLTWRWLRARSAKDRRGDDRRLTDRRDEESPDTEN